MVYIYFFKPIQYILGLSSQTTLSLLKLMLDLLYIYVFGWVVVFASSLTNSERGMVQRILFIFRSWIHDICILGGLEMKTFTFNFLFKSMYGMLWDMKTPLIYYYFFFLIASVGRAEKRGGIIGLPFSSRRIVWVDCWLLCTGGICISLSWWSK